MEHRYKTTVVLRFFKEIEECTLPELRELKNALELGLLFDFCLLQIAKRQEQFHKGDSVSAGTKDG
jgi:hypothetical protein